MAGPSVPETGVPNSIQLPSAVAPAAGFGAGDAVTRVPLPLVVLVQRADPGGVGRGAAVGGDRDVDPGGRHRRVVGGQAAVAEQRLVGALRVERTDRVRGG